MREILAYQLLLTYIAFVMLSITETNVIHDFIKQYKARLKVQGLNDEIYKFKLIKKFKDHWNLDAPDFAEMVRTTDFGNLVFTRTRAALPVLAKQRPEQTKELFTLLFNEGIPLKERIPQFRQGAEALYNEIKTDPTHQAWQEERAVATYLTFQYPEKYFLYKHSFYIQLCNVLNVKKAPAGEKYLHYLDLAKRIRDDYVNMDNELIQEVQKHLDQDCYQDPTHTVLTQDILYTVFDKVPNRLPETKEDFETPLLHRLREINDREAIEQYFNNLQTLFETASIEEDNAQLYCTAVKSNKRLSFTYGPRYIHYIERLKEDLIFGFIMTEEDASKYPPEDIVQKWDFAGGANMKLLGLRFTKEKIRSHDFKTELLACAKALNLETSREINYTHREGAHKEAHNPLIYHMAMDDDFRDKMLTKAFNISFNDSGPKSQPQTNRQTAPKAKNIILYGPPGTGKTYSTIDLAVQLADKDYGSHAANKQQFDVLQKQGQIEFITFHQNYAYEDFVVGVRPVESEGSLAFRKHEGIFYELCKRAEANYLNCKTGVKQASFEDDFGDFFKPLTEGNEINVRMLSGEGSFHIYDMSETTIRFRKQNGSTAHSLSIGTLKDMYNETREVTSGLQYYYNAILRDMKRGGAKQVNEPMRNYILIIDEINRANISKVFGELITLLEEDKRIGGENELRVSLPNGEKQFGIPPNLFLIGTMNTADKSIAHIDIALRRRFEFIGKYPAAERLSPLFARVLNGLNKAIMEYKKSPDFLIGHGYFIGRPDGDLSAIINNKVLPLLNEYFIGRTDIVKEILNEAGIQSITNAITYLLEVA